MKPVATVQYLKETVPIQCPYGNVRRIITGSKAGIANIHVVSVTRGKSHYHSGYDEIFYILSGSGTITLDGTDHPITPGAVAVIPAGTVHSIFSASEKPVEFIIFGTPPMFMDDKRAKPVKSI